MYQFNSSGRKFNLKICLCQFLCSVYIWYDILNRVNNVSKMMQNPTFNIQTVIQNLEFITTELKSCRTHQSFENIFTSATYIRN